MPKYPLKKDSQEEIRYEIQTKDNTYLLTIRKSETSIMLYIGGPYYYCLECQIFMDDNSNVANLSKIEYNENCSLTGNFERGKDTKAIINLLISYLIDNYPNIYKLIFNDFSYRSCSNNSNIDLAAFNYLLYGKTWYMKHLFAKFFKNTDSELFSKLSKQFNEKKKEMKWEDFDKFITSKHPLPNIDMERIFDNSESWNEYFCKLIQIIDIDTMCVYMSDWITNFLYSVGKIRFSSYDFFLTIPYHQSFKKTNYKLVLYTHKAGKYTRRYKKQCLDLRD